VLIRQESSHISFALAPSFPEDPAEEEPDEPWEAMLDSAEGAVESILKVPVQAEPDHEQPYTAAPAQPVAPDVVNAAQEAPVAVPVLMPVPVLVPVS
jgi:hypothetical protein